jgi:hypothetical protein
MELRRIEPGRDKTMKDLKDQQSFHHLFNTSLKTDREIV